MAARASTSDSDPTDSAHWSDFPSTPEAESMGSKTKSQSNSTDSASEPGPKDSHGKEPDSALTDSLDNKSYSGAVATSKAEFDLGPSYSGVKSNSGPPDSHDVESDSDSSVCELELLRQRNLMLRRELFNSPEFLADMAIQREIMFGIRKPAPVKRKRKPTVHAQPVEIRRSGRLRATNPVYVPMDDPEEQMYKAKRSRSTSERRSTYNAAKRVIIPVEQISDATIQNIAQFSSSKKRSSNCGTSCHQCRQKTLDQKTCCRNVDCVGVRGQFCGVCLRSRYGEDAAAALLDPNWHCPVCRGICNCSFCRIKDGKAPTGILLPTILKKGFTCVKEYLDAKRDGGTEKLNTSDEANDGDVLSEDIDENDGDIDENAEDIDENAEDIDENAADIDENDSEENTENSDIPDEINGTGSNVQDQDLPGPSNNRRSIDNSDYSEFRIGEVRCRLVRSLHSLGENTTHSDVPREMPEAEDRNQEVSPPGEEVVDAANENQDGSDNDDSDSSTDDSMVREVAQFFLLLGDVLNDSENSDDDDVPHRRLLGFNGDSPVYSSRKR